MCMPQSKCHNPFEMWNHQTNNWRRLTQSAAVEVKVKGQGKGQTLAMFFAQSVQQVTLVCCEPLQVVALKTKVYCLYSLTLCQRRGCPGSRLLLLLVQRFLLAARCFAAKLDTTVHSCAVLPQTVGLTVYPSYRYRSSPAQLSSVACAFTPTPL